jgi:hypothetical protein
MTFLPIISKTGRARSKVGRDPPHIIVRDANSAPLTPVEGDTTVFLDQPPLRRYKTNGLSLLLLLVEVHSPPLTGASTHPAPVPSINPPTSWLTSILIVDCSIQVVPLISLSESFLDFKADKTVDEEDPPFSPTYTDWTWVWVGIIDTRVEADRAAS